MEALHSSTNYITVIGGINIDIHGFPEQPLILKDSNIGEVKLSSGGVGRNIAENISKLGVKTKLLSVLGDDIYGQALLVEAKGTLLDMNDVRMMPGESTSIYLSVMDEKRDMAVAINYMDTMKKLDREYLSEKEPLISHAELCVIDTNIEEDVIRYLIEAHSRKIFFLDTVSGKKCRKVKDIIGKFHTIKPNKIEAEVLTGLPINNEEDMKRAVDYFLTRGVKQVFMTLGEEGVFYGNEQGMGHIKAKDVRIVNATGAGDAFAAAIAYSFIRQKDIHHTARFANAASIVALSHEKTINPNMSVNTVNKKMEELDYVEKIYGN